MKVTAIIALLLGAVAATLLFGNVNRQRMEAAYLAQGLAMAGPAKVRVAAYYLDEGRWPAANADVGLPAAHEFRDEAVSRLAISAGGVITVTYTEKSGVADGYIQLTPDASRLHLGIQWRCTTPSFADIGKWAPACRFAVPGPAGG